MVPECSSLGELTQTNSYTLLISFRMSCIMLSRDTMKTEHTHIHTCSYSTPLVQKISQFPQICGCVCVCVCGNVICPLKRERVSQVTVRRVFLSLKPSGKCVLLMHPNVSPVKSCPMQCLYSNGLGC